MTTREVWKETDEKRQPGGTRDDRCSCLKETGQYGAGAFHWRTDPEHPTSPARDVVIGRCQQYTDIHETLTKAQVALTALEKGPKGPEELEQISELKTKLHRLRGHQENLRR